MHLFVLLKTAAAVEPVSETLWQLPGVLGIEELPADGDTVFRPDNAHHFVRFDNRQQFDDWLRAEPFPVGFLKIYLDLPGDEHLPAWLAQLEACCSGASVKRREEAQPAFDTNATTPTCELITYGTVTPCDYIATVREQHHGRDIGKFWVGPPWETPTPGQLPVIIEPGMAFGLGDHPTTQMCLELLASSPLPARGEGQGEGQSFRILDIGTGTGVLAIAAAKFWPDAELWLTDLDPQCQSNVEHNFRLNDLPVPTHQSYGDQPLPAGLFDLVLSNLYLDVLSSLVRPVADRLRGRWIISGLLRETQAAEFRATVTPHFEILQTIRRPDGWFGLALRPRNRED